MNPDLPTPPQPDYSFIDPYQNPNPINPKKRKYKIAILVVVVLIVVAVFSIVLTRGKTKTTTVGNKVSNFSKVAEDFISDVASNDYESAYLLLDPEASIKKSEFIENMQTMTSNLDMKSCIIVDSKNDVSPTLEVVSFVCSTKTGAKKALVKFVNKYPDSASTRIFNITFGEYND